MTVLKNCEPELSYILAEHFNMCLKESSFPDRWEVSLVVPIFKNIGKMFTAKNYHPVSLPSVVSKASEKLVINGLNDHLEKCGLFVISSIILGLLIQLQIFSQLYLIKLRGLSLAIDICKALDKVWQAGFLHKLKCYGISSQMFDLVLCSSGSEWEIFTRISS